MIPIWQETYLILIDILNRDLIYPDLTFKDGVMHVPDGDGLGVTVFDDRLEAYCVEKRTL